MIPNDIFGVAGLRSVKHIHQQAKEYVSNDNADDTDYYIHGSAICTLDKRIFNNLIL